MEKEDVRVLKSKRDLRNGLLSLLNERPFEKITVGDICERAMINKMTFYKHYSDKYALIDDCLRSIALDIYRKSVAKISESKGDAVSMLTTFFSDVLDECIDKKNIILTLASGNNSLASVIIKSSIEKLVEALVIRITEGQKPKYDVRVISTFFTGGFSDLVLAWLEGNSPYNKEDFVNNSRKLFTDLLYSGVLIEK